MLGISENNSYFSAFPVDNTCALYEGVQYVCTGLVVYSVCAPHFGKIAEVIKWNFSKADKP